jgi:hypothetical protein
MAGGANRDRIDDLLAARQKYMSRNVPFSCRYTRKIDNLRNFLSECVDFEKKVTKSFEVGNELQTWYFMLLILMNLMSF